MNETQREQVRRDAPEDRQWIKHVLRYDDDPRVLREWASRLLAELEQAEQREAVLVEALRVLSESDCAVNMSGDCVGAVHSRRKRYDNPDRVEVVGCPRHFARAALADHEQAKA